MEFTGLILVLITVGFVAYIASRIDQNMRNKYGNNVNEKRCPAHNWKYVEQPGMPGTSYIVCEWCKKMPGWDREE